MCLPRSASIKLQPLPTLLQFAVFFADGTGFWAPNGAGVSLPTLSTPPEPSAPTEGFQQCLLNCPIKLQATCSLGQRGEANWSVVLRSSNAPCKALVDLGPCFFHIDFRYQVKHLHKLMKGQLRAGKNSWTIRCCGFCCGIDTMPSRILNKVSG